MPDVDAQPRNRLHSARAPPLPTHRAASVRTRFTAERPMGRRRVSTEAQAAVKGEILAAACPSAH
eukprot:3561432-Prymnesium_polylepis.1